MQAIFINPTQIITPTHYTKYYNSRGESYQRIESIIDHNSFNKDSECVRVELYDNSSSPVLVGVLHRQGISQHSIVAMEEN